MPKAARLATSHEIMPPSPPNIAYRLLILLTSTFEGNGLHIMTEKARSENNQPRVKLPQIKFPPFVSADAALTTEPLEPLYVDDDARPRAMAEATRFLGNVPYQLDEERLLIIVSSKAFVLDLPPHTREFRDFQRIIYLPVHAKLCKATPHLTGLDLQKWTTIPYLVANSQLDRAECYIRNLGHFKLADGNVITLPTQKH